MVWLTVLGYLLLVGSAATSRCQCVEVAMVRCG